MMTDRDMVQSAPIYPKDRAATEKGSTGKGPGKGPGPEHRTFQDERYQRKARSGEKGEPGIKGGKTGGRGGTQDGI